MPAVIEPAEATVQTPEETAREQLANARALVAGISIAELNADERTFTLDPGITITYRPNLITPAAARALGRQMERENRLGTCKLLAKIVSSWDLLGPVEVLDYDDDADEVIYTSYVTRGEPVPLDPEIMQHLHDVILVAVTMGVLNDVLPLEQTPS